MRTDVEPLAFEIVPFDRLAHRFAEVHGHGPVLVCCVFFESFIPALSKGVELMKPLGGREMQEQRAHTIGLVIEQEIPLRWVMPFTGLTTASRFQVISETRPPICGE